MKNVLSIFINDLFSIAKHFFALVIALAICVIPALYAWFNIYSNWDPYGGTGNIAIALVTRDIGYTLDSGEFINEGNDIVAEMAKSTSIRWVVTNYSEAMDGVHSGKYYGALVLGENLSRNMHNMTEALYDKEPAITFYQNAKTNAVANKITETAASTAEHNIQLRYLSILIEKVFAKINEVLDELDTESSIQKLIGVMNRLETALDDYCEVIEKLQAKNIDLGGRLHNAGDNISNVSLAGSVGNIQAAKESIEYTKTQALESVWNLQLRLAQMQESLVSSDLSEGSINELIRQNNEMIADLELMKASLPQESVAPTTGSLRSSIERLITQLNKINSYYEELKQSGLPAEDREILRNALLNAIGAARDFVHNNLEKSVERLFDNLTEDLVLLQNVLISLDQTISGIPPVMYAADGTLYSLNGTLKEVGKLLKNLKETVTELNERLHDVQNNDTLDSLIEMLHGDPEEFAAFLSSPVEVETETIYPVNSYGAAMTPFYSTLAIWVGCVVLCAVIKVEADGRRLRRPTEGQLYWGRFMTYAFFSQIQAFVIVWGDLHILGVECLHPLLFYFSGAVTSFTFVCLIYSLVLTIGDIGKAIVVVIMIVQIAGSSGSYPIEILPEIFSRLYLFFPYPYAINAMREAICGLYAFDYWLYLGELLVFAGIGLFVGLVLRRPLHGINEFIEEEMHESGVL